MKKYRMLALVLFAFCGQDALADGKSVFETKCFACHGTGAAGAPRLGDKAAWAPRIKLGLPALIRNTVNGKGAMPPRAGQNVSDADIKAAIEYLISKAR